MPSRTNTDAIRDLERDTAALTERLDAVLKEIAHLKAGLEQTAETVTQLRVQTAVLEERIEMLRQTVEGMQQRETRIALLVLGSFLALLANITVVILQRVL